jgi:hypothetical protein
MDKRLLTIACFGVLGSATNHLYLRAEEVQQAKAVVRPRMKTALQVRSAKPTSLTAVAVKTAINGYCAPCHNTTLKTAGVILDTLNVERVGDHSELWERVVTMLRNGMMPPAGMPRPDEATSDALRTFIQTELDKAAAAHPDPGRTEILHRLNRAEYQNAIRDLLALDVDVNSLLPADDSSNGFDNMAGSLRISQSLMERYLAAAQSIGKMAVGALPLAPQTGLYRVPADSQQHQHVEGLPFGTRGGTLIRHFFPRDANYDINIDLAGARTGEPHELAVLLDGDQIKQFTIPQKSGAKIKFRVPVAAGPHELGVTFYQKPVDLVERVKEPFQNPRVQGDDGGVAGPIPEVANVTVTGPYDDRGPGDTPSRRRIFVCHPANPTLERACAGTILSNLARRAYRGPVRQEDLNVLLAFYDEGRKDGTGFEPGLEFALERLLVSPSFLFRVETDPPGVSGNYRLSDLELASRLSFFLWSSIPDDELLNAAEQGKLKDPVVFERQVHRMLADSRSESLTKNFAGQWLQLRNLESVRPGDPYSHDFDDSLRNGLHRETEMFFDSVLRENRPVLELLTANYTFVNERVALHYGIPNVLGSEFRRVELPVESHRHGILGQGSILTITSHPNRTSPVLRGKWILANILGTPPADPPPNVPALQTPPTQAKVATLRERMAAHRAVEPCRTCHSTMDPPGFALESFDAIGRLREVDESWNALDTSGSLPDGSKFQNVDDLIAALVRRPERFANTVAEKLLVYALGRGLEYYDMPAVRKIVSDSAPDYKFQSMILSVVRSYPFLMRRTMTQTQEHQDDPGTSVQITRRESAK